MTDPAVTQDEIPQGDGVFGVEDTEILAETRTLRRQLIKQLAINGKLPDDKSDKIMLTQLLNDLDGQVISRARTKIAAKTEDNNTNMNALIAQALMKHRVGTPNPLATQDMTLPKEFSAGEIVPGETSQGVNNVTMSELGL